MKRKDYLQLVQGLRARSRPEFLGLPPFYFYQIQALPGGKLSAQVVRTSKSGEVYRYTLPPIQVPFRAKAQEKHDIVQAAIWEHRLVINNDASTKVGEVIGFLKTQMSRKADLQRWLSEFVERCECAEANVMIARLLPAIDQIPQQLWLLPEFSDPEIVTIVYLSYPAEGSKPEVRLIDVDGVAWRRMSEKPPFKPRSMPVVSTSQKRKGRSTKRSKQSDITDDWPKDEYGNDL